MYTVLIDIWCEWDGDTSLQLNSPSSLLFVNCKPVCNLFCMCFIIFAQLVVFKFSVICCAIIRHTCINVQGPSRPFYWTTCIFIWSMRYIYTNTLMGIQRKYIWLKRNHTESLIPVYEFFCQLVKEKEFLDNLYHHCYTLVSVILKYKYNLLCWVINVQL